MHCTHFFVDKLDYQTIGLWLSGCHFFCYRTIGFQTHKKLSVVQLWTGLLVLYFKEFAGEKILVLIKICKWCVKAILCTSISHMYINFLSLVNSQPVFRKSFCLFKSSWWGCYAAITQNDRPESRQHVDTNEMWNPTGVCILFSVVFNPYPPSHHGRVWVLPVSSLLLTNTVSQVQACLIKWWERFRGTKMKTIVGLLVFNPPWWNLAHSANFNSFLLTRFFN